jgi:NAD(P)-dependent dehydrogenase (short-subunit alcohol dehydrogenase family)
MGKLDGKVAVLVGGASGIGESTARLFADEGARIVIADINEDRGAEVAASIGKDALFKRTDVTSEPDVQATISSTAEELGRLDILSNNAAGPTGPGARAIEEIPVESYERSIAIFVRGVFLCMKHAAPIMKRQQSGSIINTASIAGFRAGFAPHIYSAAKAAIIQLTKSVAMELGESNVRVNCICPGGVATPFLANSMGLKGEEAKNFIEQTEKTLAMVQPMKRACTAEDVAQAILWLAGDESGFVNGHSLVVDGGVSCGRLWGFAQRQREYLQSAMKSGSFGSFSK